MDNDEKKRLGRKLTIIITAFVVVITVVIVLIKFGSGEFFYVTFKNAKGLQPGDAVMMKGLGIGEVRNIKLEKNGGVIIKVWISRKHLDFITASSTARIVSQSMPNVSGRKHLEWLILNDKNAELLQPGTTVTGSENIIDFNVKKAKLGLKPVKEKLSDVAGAVKEEVERIKEKFKELKDDIDFKQISEDIKELADKAKTTGADKLIGFKDKIRTIKEKIKSAREKYKKEGKKDIVEEFDGISQYIENTEDKIVQDSDSSEESISGDQSSDEQIDDSRINSGAPRD